MERRHRIKSLLKQCLDGIKGISKEVINGRSIFELEKEVWTVYKDCESTVFLTKLEIGDIEAADNTKIEIPLDHLERVIYAAEEHLRNAEDEIENGRLNNALEQTRQARNIMAEVYSMVRKENIKQMKSKKATYNQSPK
ncbi:MAG: hypothetical protein QXJ17_01880 [Nitrososphaeria archaeon]